MIINPYKFPFSVIEGMDGCGKDTIIVFLKAHFGERAVFTVEPTDGTYGRQFRYALAHQGKDIHGRQLSPEEIQRLCVWDRIGHRVEEARSLHVKPVISNRDFESTCAYYQAFGGNVADIALMHEEEFYNAGGEFFVSDLTVIIDITAEEALKRQVKSFAAQGKKFDHFEDDMKKREKICQAYLALPQTLKDLRSEVSFNIHIVDGMQSKEEVFAEVLTLVRETFKQKTGEDF
jgi:thymidylate kinase